MEWNSNLINSSETRSAATTSSDFVLQWGNRKRLRCMKFQQPKDRDSTTTTTTNVDSSPGQRTSGRVERRVVRSDENKDSSQPGGNINITINNHNGNGYLNLRQRPASPSQRILRYFIIIIIFQMLLFFINFLLARVVTLRLADWGSREWHVGSGRFVLYPLYVRKVMN